MTNKQYITVSETIRLKKKMLTLGLTQTQLAIELGISVQRVNDALYGRYWGKRYIGLIKKRLYPPMS